MRRDTRKHKVWVDGRRSKWANELQLRMSLALLCRSLFRARSFCCLLLKRCRTLSSNCRTLVNAA